MIILAKGHSICPLNKFPIRQAPDWRY